MKPKAFAPTSRLVPIALVAALGSGLAPFPQLGPWSLSLIAPAHAQWIWRDEKGNKMISDSPPPPNVKAADILRQPSGSALPPEGEAAPAPGQAPARAQAAPARKTVADQELEFRKRQQEREKAEAKQAADEARAARQAEECQRARGYVRALEDGTPLVRTESDGSRNFLDDEQRAAEMKRAREAVSQLCG